MQTIESKLARVLPFAKTAGLTADQARHLIHGTGGSPRRAKRAIRLGIHEQLIAAYEAALSDGGSHASAVIACNGMWMDLAPSAEQDDEQDKVAAEAAPARRPKVAPLAESVAAIG